jgi:hypothetical protein
MAHCALPCTQGDASGEGPRIGKSALLPVPGLP